jgi:hypothetical protein
MSDCAKAAVDNATANIHTINRGHFIFPSP